MSKEQAVAYTQESSEDTTESSVAEFEGMSFYPSRKGDIPFFDHPLMVGHKNHPAKYLPLTTHGEVFSAMKQGQIDEEDIQIMKIVGDSIAIHEEQIRRIMSKAGYSASQSSKKLNNLRRSGFVTRWKCRLDHDEEEEIKPPAPFTLGMAGFRLLSDLYPDQRFMKSESWDQYAIPSLQRYVSLNEIRTTLAVNGVLRDWQWNVGMNMPHSRNKVSGVAKVESPNGMLHFLIERAQMGQNFVGFLRTKLKRMEQVYKQFGDFKLKRIQTELPIVVLYCSTFKMAEHLHYELILDKLPFTTWLCVEEDYMENGSLGKAFYQIKGDTLEPIALPFLD